MMVSSSGMSVVGNVSYDSIRANVNSASDDALSRVEVNQRALIDKILARYASQGAVYRELIQNSNDADASEAEIYFTTTSSTATTSSQNNNNNDNNNIVSQVVYRNNGMPFRHQDWDRLKKIAEGNPDVSKVGAFGVGAYTMFSICEEPIVLSGNAALAFVWKGDALWTKTIPNEQSQENQRWTSFVLPSRDPYPVPDLLEFGEFLCASLTFTAKLRSLKVFVNNVQKLHIQKSIAQEPRLVQTPKSTSGSSFWLFNTNQTVMSSSKGVFSLAKSNDGTPAIYESIHRMTVTIDNNVSATLDARYVSATAKTNVPVDMARRMERVTKKNPPPTVDIQIFLNANAIQGNHNNNKTKNIAEKIVQSFSPRSGQGRIFIGFRTSQTTGLAAHLAAPFVPTVEREAMDLQDAALRIFNTELLEFSGILMRLTLEHTMLNVIGVEWDKNAEQRTKEEKELLLKLEKDTTNNRSTPSSQETAVKNGNNEDENNDGDDEDDGTLSISAGGLMGFARFMARGVKKSIVTVAKTVGGLIETNTDTLLYPPDPRPLSNEEKQAVVLMQSFCPQQSTPDATVGTCLATGFSRCLPNQAPPVLTRSGVMRGDLARLPNYGIEAFCESNTIRTVVFQNCEEYHTVIARCRKLNLDDLYDSISKQILEEKIAIKLIHWWVRYSRVEPIDATQKGYHLKQLIRFYPEDGSSSTSKNLTGNTNSEVERKFIELDSLEHYCDKESIFSTNVAIPLPDSVISRPLQAKIGFSVLNDSSLYRWFSVLPMEVWVHYISTCSVMTDAKPEDEELRVQILACLNQEYLKRSQQERAVFGNFCHSLFAGKRCLPFDSNEPTPFAADYPGDLYLSSAELDAFKGVGSAAFHKVAASLHNAGVSDDFLLCLGVRKSVSIDFLFTNLDTLRWSEDPKSLIEYLRTATLTRNDLNKLSTTRYLPAEQDKANTYAPSQLYLPNNELRLFPFVKMLQWPSETEVSENSSNGQFLIKLGMKKLPQLQSILDYMSSSDVTQEQRMKCLDFVCNRLGPHGIYHATYSQMTFTQKLQYRFLPSVVRSPIEACFSPTEKIYFAREDLHSPVTCFSDEICGVMGFPIIDPQRVGAKNCKLYGSLFLCDPEPEGNILLNQLGQLVTQTKNKQAKVPLTAESAIMLEATFNSIFKYLSHRCTDINFGSVEGLKKAAFIPVRIDETNIEWYRPDQVFFQRKGATSDDITAELFRVVEFNPFLAAAGVKEEATTKDLFTKLLSSPGDVLKTLGSEKKYRALLRRIAANPPFHPGRVPPEVSRAPFLLAYTVKQVGAAEQETKDEMERKVDETTTYHLAKASDIYIIDNSFFARMFPVKRAPPESDLEDFYARLGSRYISQSVDRRFEIVGKPSDDTPLTHALKERLHERGPLLVSPNVTSRPLVPDAVSVIDERHLQVYEAKNLLAVYSLDGTVRRNQTTCCSRELGKKANAIYVVKDFDWFDVGNAIGDLILRRCQLEDAFFISSLLEAPLEQLRSRGFPVDRILQAEQPIPETPPQTEQKIMAPAPTMAQIPAPTVARIPPQPVSPTPLPNNSNESKSTNVPTTTTMPQQKKSEPNKVEPEASVSKATSDKSSHQGTESKGNEISKEGLHEILMQMFPDADPNFIVSALGENPNIEDVRILAEQMSQGRYPKSDNNSNGKPKNPEPPVDVSKSKSGGLRKKFGRALGFGGTQTPSVPPSGVLENGASQTGGQVIAQPPSMGSTQKHVEQREPVSPASDAQAQHNLERMLENTVEQSTKVNTGGIHANETKLTSIPKELDHDCEIIPAQSLKPYAGPRGTGKTRNGIRVFSSRLHPESEAFLNEYEPVLESFAHVIHRLCVDVYGLPLDTIAIYHDPAGSSIAFNSNRSLHFNLRFFHALHFLQNKHLGIECYSYWYMTIAHELAHHMVSAHTREHGFYTESYASHYLPKLIILISDL